MKALLISAGIVAMFGIATGANAAGDIEKGKAKAKACAGCHGANGEGVKPNPVLAGKSAEDIVEALKAYKSGKRANPIMKTFASALSDEDMANVAAYYSSLKK
jgi:cytochrome c553